MEKIWKEFHDRLYQFILTKVNSKEEAEDILQEVFIKIYLKSDTLKDKIKLTSWVFQICRNTITDYYRKHKIETIELNFDLEIQREIEQQMCSCLYPFIEKLPSDFKEIIIQTTFKNKSIKDFAIENDISYAAAKSRIQRARKSLKNSFFTCCQMEADKYGNLISPNHLECNC